MKVTFVDQKLRKHCIELEGTVAIASITAMLVEKYWPVPSGFSPKLVYEKRALLEHESLCSIGYVQGKFISFLTVRQSAKSAKSAQGSMSEIDVKFSRELCSNPSDMTVSGPTLSAECSIREFARVRVDGLTDWHWDWRIDGVHASPSMNGRTGVICGAFIADTGRWPVKIDGNDSSSQLQIALRPCNIQLHRAAGEGPPMTTGTVPTQALFEEGQRLYGEQRFSDAAECWGRAALLQHGPSHAHLSNMLIDGRADVAKDKKRAFELASAGTALGCAHSKGVLGRCCVWGHGVAEDAARGLALGRESEAADSCFGQNVVGVCYNLGCGGVAQDHAEALRLYRLAAEQGLAGAQNNLGLMFENGEGVAQDYAEAARLYRLAAEQGLAEAQKCLGNMFYNGEGVAQDYAEAARLYRLAAEQGLAEAQFNLGLMFENGQGVAQDYAEAALLYRLAAEQGLAEAQNNLGLMFENGEGVAQDYAEAARLYRLAAEQGLAEAQKCLGLMFYNGEGVAQDYAEAALLYRLAAEQGHAEAQFNLGLMFYNGEGVAQDYAEAARLYRLAAEQGHAEAQKCLGNMAA
jgi:TPR repeat protein